MPPNQEARSEDRKVAPFTGDRGEPFRTFKRDFLVFARGKFAKDDQYSYHTAFTGTDQGGVAAGAPPLPATQAAAQKQAVRRNQAFTFLYDLIDEPRLRQMLSDLADANPPHAAGIAKAAWDLVLQECDDSRDDLEVGQLDLIWATLTILNSIGYKISTISDFARHLNLLNGQRPNAQRKSENEVACKFLQSITHPETLAARAARELRATGARREFHKGGPNYDRDLNAMVREFDDVWRSLFQIEGGPIRARPVQRGNYRYENALLHETNAQLRENNSDDGDDDECYLITFDDGDEMFFVGARNKFPKRNNGGAKPVRFQKVCRNCWGFDHPDKDCPSSKRDRPLDECIQVLQRIQRAQNGGGNAGNRLVTRHSNLGTGVGSGQSSTPKHSPLR